jgi:predicted nucleic acid-binding protein
MDRLSGLRIIMNILLPPKIYLDTNHLIGITKARQSASTTAYSSIDGYLRNGYVGIIFSPAAPLDWVDGKATIESAKEIAEVVDSARLQYEIEKDSFVFLHEIQAELRRLEPGIRLPDFDVLFLRDISKAAPRALPVLKNMVPGFFKPGELLHSDAPLPNEIPFSTVAEHVERAYLCKTERPAVYQERVDGHKAAYQHDREGLAERHNKSLTSTDHLGWMKRFVRIDRIITALNPDLPVDELLSRVDFTKCPAVNLFLNAHMARVKAKHVVHDNDVDDWMIVHIVPFAEVVLTERKLAHFIRQADPSLGERVTHDPEKAIEILRPWIGESG